jgi:hypothetical protein
VGVIKWILPDAAPIKKQHIEKERSNYTCDFSIKIKNNNFLLFSSSYKNKGF